MTALGNVYAGSAVSAAMLQGVAPLAVVKGSDQSLTSNTTLQGDNALLLPVVADAVYLFDCYLDYEGGARGSSDIQWQWSVPVGATLRYQPIYSDTSGNAQTGQTVTGSATVTAGTGGAGYLRGATMTGSLIVSSTAGNVQLMWAQNTSSTTPTIVHAQSLLTLWRIA